MGKENTPCPNASPDCPYFDTERGCHIDEHHRVWPARLYTEPVEIAYRNLQAHTEQICRHEHDTIHAYEEPPPKESHESMRITVAQAIRLGEIVHGLSGVQKKRILHLVPEEMPQAVPIIGDLYPQQT